MPPPWKINHEWVLTMIHVLCIVLVHTSTIITLDLRPIETQDVASWKVCWIMRWMEHGNQWHNIQKYWTHGPNLSARESMNEHDNRVKKITSKPERRKGVPCRYSPCSRRRWWLCLVGGGSCRPQPWCRNLHHARNVKPLKTTLASTIAAYSNTTT